MSECPEAVGTTTTEWHDGDWRFGDGGQYQFVGERRLNTTWTIPPACFGESCDDVQSALGWPCTHAGDACRREENGFFVREYESGRWHAEVSTLVLEPDAGDARKFDYCATGDYLLLSGAGGTRFVLER
jgi:hypothetical protein